MLGLRTARERERHPDPTGSPMGIPIRWEPGNRGKTPDRAVGSPGHLGHLTYVEVLEREVVFCFLSRNFGKSRST